MTKTLRQICRLILFSCIATISSLPTAAEPIRVVATFSIIADITQQVGGDRVMVQSLVGPDADAHVFQPSPKDARALAEARLVVANGLGFEGWIGRFLGRQSFRFPGGIQGRGGKRGAETPFGHGDLRRFVGREEEGARGERVGFRTTKRHGGADGAKAEQEKNRLSHEVAG